MQQFGNDQAQISINTPTSTSDLMINSWNVNTVFIDATFTVNSPFNVDNSTIKFGPNGRIVVVAGGDFRSTESRYFSCTPVGWAGIHVDGGITLLTTNYIEDAHKAITIANSAAFLSIIENNFNRNVIDIFIPWPVKANAIIAGNLFEATSPLYNGGQSQIGIYADTRTVVFVGLPQTTDVKAKNTFKNHVKGAEGMSATMNFRYAEFLCNSNFGILAKGGRIDIRGSGNYRNLFQKNLADIRVSGSNFYTFGSDFRECLTNNVTSIENLNGQTVEIGSTALNLENTFEIDNNNAFSDFKTGIILDRPTGGGECKIWDNSMTISPWTPNKGRTAIRIIGQPGTMTPTSLFRNVITMFEGGSNPGWTNVINCPMIDIELNRAGNFVLFQNTIFTQNLDLIDHRNRWGFYLHDYEFPAPKSGVHDNDVIGSQPGFDHGMCAYHFIKTGPLEICDNWADYTLRGFHITDNCATSNFAVNHFGHHSRSNAPNDPSAAITGALQMENGSKIGPQFCKHNIWHVASYAPDRAAWHKGNMGNVSESRFDINPFLPGEVSSPIHPASGWFFPLCDEEPGGGHCDMLLTNTTLDEFEQKTAQENQSYTPPATVLQWEERKQLMAKLIRYPGLKALYPLANTFYDVHLNTSAGQFAQFDEMLHDARTIAANDTLALQNIRNQITYWVSRVDSLDGTLQNLAVAQTAGL
ncbi:MAG: hypothetical protein SFV22_15475, partial [Saprospiraceae bacterium]|nr:hypothetical protein [Saprospiraceae bacterium]